MNKFNELYNKIIKENIDSTGIGTDEDNYITDGFYEIKYLKPYEIEKLHNFTVKYKLSYNSETGRWDCDHKLDIYRDVKWEICVQGGNKLGIMFGVINGAFMVETGWLHSLEGCPTKVMDKFFVCEHQINSFYGGPETVYGNFHADACGVTTLKGLPKYVGGNLLIEHCNHLNKCDLDPNMEIKGNTISFYGCSEAAHSREFYDDVKKNLPKTFNGDVILPNGHNFTADQIRSGNFSDPSWC